MSRRPDRRLRSSLLLAAGGVALVALPAWHRLATRLAARRAEPATAQAGDRAQDTFCREPPTPEAAVDLFSGEWSSRLPPPYEDLTGASAELFSDKRIWWADEVFGGVRGMRVLELGPLEGGHTYMLDRLGATQVTAIEANRRAFLRCLVVKELLGMPSSRFLLGDFMPYLRTAADRQERWDLCLAVGVLYHQRAPVSLLELATSVSDRILLWTHYYDEEILAARSDHAARFSGSFAQTTAGFPHTLHRHVYRAALEWRGFCGGSATWAAWMEREELLSALSHFGFTVLGIEFDHSDHPNGPALCIAAERTAR